MRLGKIQALSPNQDLDKLKLKIRLTCLKCIYVGGFSCANFASLDRFTQPKNNSGSFIFVLCQLLWWEKNCKRHGTNPWTWWLLQLSLIGCIRNDEFIVWHSPEFWWNALGRPLCWKQKSQFEKWSTELHTDPLRFLLNHVVATFSTSSACFGPVSQTFANTCYIATCCVCLKISTFS